MGFFESLGFGKKRLAESELFQALLTARRQGDMRRFAKLCRDHSDVIVAAVPRWQKPPSEVAANSESLNEYVQTLGTAAELLRDAGHPELWDALVGNPDDNPIFIWEEKLKEANSLANETRFNEAAELLMNHLIDTRQLQGNAADRLQAMSQGALGHFRFSGGRVDDAIGHYEQALRLCREQQDNEGLRIYLSSLYESQRYLGKIGFAADYAQELEQRWTEAGNAALAKRFGRLSQIVRAGEPALRVVAHYDGKVMELDEVEMKPTMNLELRFWRNRPALPGATKKIGRGKELAGQQQYADALELFHDAAKIDPYEPDGHYQAGMVLCEQQLYPQAIEAWQTCETLAPGWFFCRSYLWVARQLALGEMSHGVFLALRFLQDGPMDPRKQMDIANRVRSQAEAVPLFGFLYGDLLQKAGRPKEAAQLWHKMRDTDSEPDVRTRLLVSLSTIEENPDNRRQLLQEAVDLNGNLIAAATAALSLKLGKRSTK